VAVQARPSDIGTLEPAPPAGAFPTSRPLPPPPHVEVVGRRVGPATTPRTSGPPARVMDAAVLNHQLHEIDQVVEIARLSELVAEKDARILLLERGIADWRERARAEASGRAAAERRAFDRERDLIGVIHKQLSTIDAAETTSHTALARNDELQARIDLQIATIESSEQTSQAALARMFELQARIDDLDEQLRLRLRRWWSRKAR
jgi:hypothetical protein